MNTKIAKITKKLNTLTNDDLNQLSDQIHDLIEARKLSEAIAVDVTAPTQTATGRKSNRRQQSAPWIETRIVKGHAYRYQVQWVNWKREVTYLGKA